MLSFVSCSLARATNPDCSSISTEPRSSDMPGSRISASFIRSRQYEIFVSSCSSVMSVYLFKDYFNAFCLLLCLFVQRNYKKKIWKVILRLPTWCVFINVITLTWNNIFHIRLVMVLISPNSHAREKDTFVSSWYSVMSAQNNYSAEACSSITFLNSRKERPSQLPRLNAAGLPWEYCVVIECGRQ